MIKSLSKIICLIIFSCFILFTTSCNVEDDPKEDDQQQENQEDNNQNNNNQDDSNDNNNQNVDGLPWL